MQPLLRAAISTSKARRPSQRSRSASEGEAPCRSHISLIVFSAESIALYRLEGAFNIVFEVTCVFEAHREANEIVFDARRAFRLGCESAVDRRGGMYDERAVVEQVCGAAEEPPS